MENLTERHFLLIYIFPPFHQRVIFPVQLFATDKKQQPQIMKYMKCVSTLYSALIPAELSEEWDFYKYSSAGSDYFKSAFA